MTPPGKSRWRGWALQGLVLWLAASLSVGCATTWPRVTAVSDARFAATAAASIDVLPIDLEVWVQQGLGDDAEQVRVATESHIVGAVAELLYRHGHQVGAFLDWRGSYVGAGGQEVAVMQPAELLATIDSLASYGTAMKVTPHELPVPYLPVRLGQRTGAEATLYIGGWGFVGRKADSTGETVLKVVLVSVIVIGVVALLAAIAKDGDGVGKLLDGAGKGVGSAARAMASAGRTALHAMARAGTAVVDLTRAAVDVSVDVAQSLPHDAFGRSETHLNLVSGGRPEWSKAPDAKVSGASALYLEMTLVDNATGLVRWHAHQRFPANPKNAKQVARAVATMLAAMPHLDPGAAPRPVATPMPMPPPTTTLPDAAPLAPPGAAAPGSAELLAPTAPTDVPVAPAAPALEPSPSIDTPPLAPPGFAEPEPQPLMPPELARP